MAPQNTLSRKDVERQARLTETKGSPRPVAKTYCRKKPQVSRRSLDLSALARWALAMRPELQRFSPPLDQNAYRCGYYSYEIESRQARPGAPHRMVAYRQRQTAIVASLR